MKKFLHVESLRRYSISRTILYLVHSHTGNQYEGHLYQQVENTRVPVLLISLTLLYQVCFGTLTGKLYGYQQVQKFELDTGQHRRAYEFILNATKQF